MDENHKDKRFMNIPEKNPMIVGVVTKVLPNPKVQKYWRKTIGLH